MKEWITIEDFDNYEINKEGVIKNKITKRLSFGSKNQKGYIICRLTYFKDGNTTRKDFYVHYLVAKYFLPNPNNYKYVYHKDGKKTNPHVDNLEWKKTLEEDVYIKSKGGYPLCEYDLDGNYIRTWVSAGVIEDIYSISSRTIHDVLKGKNKTAYGRQWRLFRQTKGESIDAVKLSKIYRLKIEERIKKGDYNFDVVIPPCYLYQVAQD